jgi:hypothetical protein
MYKSGAAGSRSADLMRTVEGEACLPVIVAKFKGYRR